MFEFIKGLFKSAKVYSVGPNNFAELLKQFDQPAKQKTTEDIVRDYTVKETMAALELSYLRESPATFYRGSQAYYSDGVKHYDWVPCATRPEVMYCCYGKS